MWVYFRSEPGLWTVGFFDPEGDWNSDSDHDDRGCAARRVSFLNGSPDSAFVPTCCCGGVT